MSPKITNAKVEKQKTILSKKINNNNNRNEENLASYKNKSPSLNNHKNKRDPQSAAHCNNGKSEFIEIKSMQQTSVKRESRTPRLPKVPMLKNYSIVFSSHM